MMATQQADDSLLARLLGGTQADRSKYYSLDMSPHRLRRALATRTFLAWPAKCEHPRSHCPGRVAFSCTPACVDRHRRGSPGRPTRCLRPANALARPHIWRQSA